MLGSIPGSGSHFLHIHTLVSSRNRVPAIQWETWIMFLAPSSSPSCCQHLGSEPVMEALSIIHQLFIYFSEFANWMKDVYSDIKILQGGSAMVLASKASIGGTCIPYRCRFESQLPPPRSTSLLMHLGTQRRMAPVLGCLHPHGRPWRCNWLWTSQLQPLQPVEVVNQWMENSLPLSASLVNLLFKF